MPEKTINFFLCNLDTKGGASCACRHEDPCKNQPVVFCESPTVKKDGSDLRVFERVCGYRSVLTVKIPGEIDEGGELTSPEK